MLFGLDSIHLRSGDSPSLSPLPTTHPKSVESKKNQLPATNFANIIFPLAKKAKISVTWHSVGLWSPESDAADQASLYLCQVLHKWGYGSLFSTSLPELVSSFPCSWILPTEINVAAPRSADPVWLGREEDNLTWKISNCLRVAEGG